MQAQRADLHFCTFTPRIPIPHSSPEAHHRPHSTSRRKAAPDGASNTVERLHKRHQRRTALMFQDTLAKEGGSSAQTLPPSHPTADDSLRFELREHVRKLRLILPV